MNKHNISNHSNWPDVPISHDAGFIPTNNKQGYMLEEPDILMQAFIDESVKTHLPVVDIGAAYGVATRAALKAGAKEVLAIDPDPEHINYMRKHFSPFANNRLKLLQASFPCELPYDFESIGAVLFSRIFHFFTPNQIEQSLEIVKKYLVKDGRIFVLVLSVYTNYFKDFIPDYETRLASGVQWPGMVDNLHCYLTENDAANNPESIHLFTPEVLSRVFEDKGFIVESCTYATRDDYPLTIKYDGREDVVLIAKKI